MPAQEKSGNPHWSITAECQMLMVPQKLAFRLIPDLGDEQKIDTTWIQVQKLIEQGEIELLGTLLIKGAAGRRLLSEAIDEMRYPTEYQPPQLPDKIPQENAVEALRNWPFVGITPTAFETRNIGQVLELETFVSNDGQWIDAKLVAQHTRFMRWYAYDAGRLSNGERLAVEQPAFHTLRNISDFRLRNGQRVLIGIHRPPEPNQKSFELFVLQVKAAQSGIKE